MCKTDIAYGFWSHCGLSINVCISSRDDVVVHRLDSGVKYTQVMICPQPARRKHIDVVRAT